MAIVLGMSRDDIDDALQRLLDAGLVVMRPWRAGGRDGVWQLSQSSPRQAAPRTGTVLTAADVLRSLGFPSSWVTVALTLPTPVVAAAQTAGLTRSQTAADRSPIRRASA